MGETINQGSCPHELVHVQSRNDQVRRSHHSKKMVNLVLFFALALVECDFFWLVTPQEGFLQKECNGSEYAVVGTSLSHLHQELSMLFSVFQRKSIHLSLRLLQMRIVVSCWRRFLMFSHLS